MRWTFLALEEGPAHHVRRGCDTIDPPAPETVSAMTRRLTFILWLLALGAAGDAQTPSPAVQTPTFRSSVRLIDVDVFVTDQGGRPIKGLTQDDFELLEDGKPQDIRAFTPVDLPVDVQESSRSDAANRPEPDVVTNTDPGRLYVIVLDSPYVQFPDSS